MKQVDEMYREICELERQCPAPTLEEFREMESGGRPYRYEVFFLGLLGEIECYLNEAIKALWQGYGCYNFSNFRMNLRRDSRLTQRAEFLIQRREQSRSNEGCPGE